VLNIPCLISDDRERWSEDLHSLTQLHEVVLQGQLRPLERVFADTQYVLQPFRVTSVRQGDWKYIAHYNRGTAVTGLQEELYDLRVDPGECRNLLLDRAIHTMRTDWNAECLWNSAPDAKFGYASETIAAALAPLRDAIAAIWSEGLLRQLRAHDHPILEEFREVTKAAPPTATMAIVSHVARQFFGKVTYYLAGANDGEDVVVPLPHPGLPDGPGHTHFSPLFALDLHDLFDQNRD
jgi:hypothetical protein